jgi:uncharacterized protein
MTLEKPEEHAHAVVFSSAGSTRYLFDAATSSVHPWPWSITGDRLDGLYACEDGEVGALVARASSPAWLADYVLAWRGKAGAFRSWPDAHACASPCAGCASKDASRQPPERRITSPAIYANLLLIVTDSCNLRCKYCLFSGHYASFHNYRARVMDHETARKAVEHFFALNELPAFQAAADRKTNIAFFGGEPLLEGELIRDVVTFAKARARPHHTLDFSATTNLTHLPDDLAAFFVREGVGLQVSLDGPPEEHDRYRCYPDGRGSYAVIRSNLEKLRALSPRYFDERVRAVVTLNGNSDLEAINRYFESGDPAVPQVSFIGYVRDLECSSFHEAYPFDPHRLRAQYDRLVAEYVGLRRAGHRFERGRFMRQFLEEPLSTLYRRLMWTGAPRRTAYTGTCQPGRRIAVGTDGRFHICERIGEGFPIGHVDIGLDAARCEAVERAYYESLPDCDRCWARALCTVCFAVVAREEHFELPERRCVAVRAEMAHRLGLLYTLLEGVPDPFPSGDPLVDRHDLVRLPS